MLEQLESIPWSTLLHAYGPATDVPQQIQALASANPETRERALWELYGNIFHQGTRYQATPYAVPFLYELLRTASVPDKHDLIYLLVSLALGYEEIYLPDGLDTVAFRSRLAQAEQQLSSAERAEYEKYGSSPRIEIDCYDAVRQEVPTLLGLLNNDDPHIRTAAVYALAWFPEEVATSLPRIFQLLNKETEPVTIATVILTIGLLARETSADEILGKLSPFLFHDALLIRVAAAIGVARKPLDPRTVDILIEALTIPEELQRLNADMRFNEGNLAGYASLVLARYGSMNRAQIVPALCQTLRGVSPYQSLDVTRALLEMIVSNTTTPIRDMPPDRLDALQQQGLQAIADYGGWRFGKATFANYSGLVRSYGLPDSQEALQQYLQNRPEQSS